MVKKKRIKKLREPRSLNQISQQLHEAIRSDRKGRDFCLYLSHGVWIFHAMGSGLQINADEKGYYQGLAGIYSKSAFPQDMVYDMQYLNQINLEKKWSLLR